MLLGHHIFGGVWPETSKVPHGSGSNVRFPSTSWYYDCLFENSDRLFCLLPHFSTTVGQDWWSEIRHCCTIAQFTRIRISWGYLFFNSFDNCHHLNEGRRRLLICFSAAASTHCETLMRSLIVVFRKLPLSKLAESEYHSRNSTCLKISIAPEYWLLCASSPMLGSNKRSCNHKSWRQWTWFVLRLSSRCIFLLKLFT